LAPPGFPYLARLAFNLGLWLGAGAAFILNAAALNIIAGLTE